tara:strand:+ start:435 stop:1094 length:660 start_codon:yes stop_codon:yes gene_type:complete
MATVRFSETLKDNIRRKAKDMFKQSISKAEQDFPTTWADKIYDCFFPADVVAKFNALPAYAMKEETDIGFTGFRGVDVEERDSYSFNNSITLRFSSPRRWPHNFDKDVTGFHLNYSSGDCVWGDPRWDWLKPEVKAYTDKINAEVAKQDSLLEGINKLMDTYSTLAPALKAWPALWDLLDDDTRERHKKVVERNKTGSDTLDVDLNKMTAAVTYSKLTR